MVGDLIIAVAFVISKFLRLPKTVKSRQPF